MVGRAVTQTLFFQVSEGMANQKLQKDYRPGTIGAILDLYEDAVTALRIVLRDVTDDELVAVADAHTQDPNCKSIQAVLAHLVRAGYTYAIMLETVQGKQAVFRDRVYHRHVADFGRDLDEMFAYNVAVLSQFEDAVFMETDPATQMLASWGQTFDPDQLMEHAVMHILRHTRQIGRFLISLRA